jgi:hypothetical protein
VGVPEVITGRPVSDGYSIADWATDLGPAGEEWMAQSNTRLVDREALAAGEEFDSPEFIEGMREWGFSVTASDPVGKPASWQEAPESAENGAQAAPSFSVELVFENFHVHRVVGDGWPTSRDEIRWLSGGSSDKIAAESFVSREFGGNEALEGKTPEFDPWSRRHAFAGPVSAGLAMNIECWEWDTGDGNIDSIGEAVHRFNRNVLLSTAWSIAMELSGVGILSFLSDMAMLAVTVIGAIAKDDFSARRTLYLDRYDLAVLSYRGGGVNWHFNGDGHHELRAKFNTTVPFPTGTLEYAVHNGLSWGAPVPLPWQSMSAPVLARYGGSVRAMFVRPSDQAVMWTSLAGTTWTQPRTIQDWKSLLPPALAVFDDKLYCVHAGLDGTLWLASYSNGLYWTQPTTVAGIKADKVAPALGASPSQLLLSYVTPSGKPYDRTSTGLGWSSPQEAPFGWETTSPVTLTRGGDTVYKAIRTMDNKVSLVMSDAPTGFSWRTTDAPAGTSTCGPTLVKWIAQWMFMRSEGGTRVGARRPNNTSPWTVSNVGSGAPLKPLDEAAAVIDVDKMYVMYRR